MEIKIREVVANDYTEVVFLWNDVLGIRNVNDENFRVTMEQMNKVGNYRTFVALFENDVVGFVTSSGIIRRGSDWLFTYSSSCC